MGQFDRKPEPPDGTLAEVTEINQHPDFIPEPREYNAMRPLTASAEKIDLKKKSGLNSLVDQPYKEWQNEAWEYYDAIGEIKFAFTLLASVMSRIRIYAAVAIDPDSVPASVTTIMRRQATRTDAEGEEDDLRALNPPDGVTTEMMKYMDRLVRDLGSGKGGFPGLMRQFTLNMSVPGECYLCQIEGRWEFKSTDEVRIRETDRKPVLRLMRSSGNRVTGDPRDKELPEKTYIGRIWKSHPRWSGEPDSSMLGLREMCDELLTLQRMIRSIARSKMNAGLVFVPDGITAAASTVDEDIEDDQAQADAFEREFMNAMITPVSDESSAATVSPMVARGPAELGDKIKYTKFERTADKDLVERADRTLERILQGIDIPKDVVSGMANVKYTNAINIDESLYKAHVEPLALLLVDSLTQIYLKPALKKKFNLKDGDESEDLLSKLVIWYDPTEVVTKPDPAAAAKILHDAFVISNDAFRRANGYADSDAPDEDEIANRLAIEKASIAAAPEIVTALIKHLLPDVFKAAQQAAAGSPQGNAPPMPQSAQDLLGIGGQGLADGSQAPADDSIAPAPGESSQTPPPGAQDLVAPQ